MTEPFTRLECYNRLGLRGHLGRNPHLVEGLSGDLGSRAAAPSAVPEAVGFALGLVLVHRRGAQDWPGRGSLWPGARGHGGALGADCAHPGSRGAGTLFTCSCDR